MLDKADKTKEADGAMKPKLRWFQFSHQLWLSIRERFKKRQFTLRFLFLVVTVCAVIMGIPHLYKVFVAAPLVGGFIDYQPNPGGPRYCITEWERTSRMIEWFKNSTYSFSSSHPKLDCEIKFFAMVESKTFRISSLHPTSKDPPKYIYFLWDGQVRKGDYQTFREIVSEPTSISKLDISRFVYYRDKNGDGLIDYKWQELSTIEGIIWKDTDGDGYFDLGYILNDRMGTESISSKRKIHIKVPVIE